MVYLTMLPPELPRSEQAKTEHNCAWALLRLGLLRKGLCDAGTTVEDVVGRTIRGPHGKPFFSEPDRQFSISHSRGTAGCALETVPVGLDIERVRRFTPGLAEKICAPEEAAIICGADRDVLLTQLWTCKESHMKLTGLGLSQGLQETIFSSLGATPQLAGQGEAYFHSTSFRHGGELFWLTLCSAEPVDLNIEWIDFESLNTL